MERASREEPSSQETNKGFLRVDVRGEDPSTWTRLQAKLIKSIEGLLDALPDDQIQPTIRDEARNVTKAMLDSFKERLARPGLENDRILAEIKDLYARMAKTEAEARVEHAKAEKIEIENHRAKFEHRKTQLIIVLGLTKGLLIGKKKREALIFSKRIDAFMDALRQSAELPPSS